MDEFTTENGHLNLQSALEEVIFLYYAYGKDDDSNLTQDAIVLKHDINNFVNTIKKLV